MRVMPWALFFLVIALCSLLFSNTILPKVNGNLSFSPLFNDEEKLETKDILSPYILNVFASWCSTCLTEHAFWMKVIEQERSVPLYGINYLDNPEKAMSWLKKYGNPYKKVGRDNGSVLNTKYALKGVPETFVFDADGKLITRITGNVTEEIWLQKIKPLL